MITVDSIKFYDDSGFKFCLSSVLNSLYFYSVVFETSLTFRSFMLQAYVLAYFTVF